MLVLSFPGDARTLSGRAVSRLLGTLLGIAVFLPLTGVRFGSVAFTAWLCLLVWPMARLSPRNYLLGSVVITVFALSLTVPLAPTETPVSLGIDRALDTVVAVTLSLLAIWAFRPWLKPNDAS